MNEQSTEKHTVVIERDLPHNPEKVWRALTESSLITQWLMKNDFQPEPGHVFTFSMDPVPGWNGIIDGKVLTVEPFTKLGYTWTSMGLETIVIFTLTAMVDGTHLKLEQYGFPSNSDASFKGATYGWTSFLNKMGEVVDGLQ